MFPLNVEMPVIKKDGTRTTLGDITGDIDALDERLDDVADSITPVSQTGTKATAAITAGTYFYLGGAFVEALTDIAINDTFTENTNYKTVDGGLNDLKEQIDSLETSVTGIQAIVLDKSKITDFTYTYAEATIAANGNSGDLSPTNSLPSDAIVLGLRSIYTGSQHAALPYFIRADNGKIGLRNVSGSSISTTPSLTVYIYNPNLT